MRARWTLLVVFGGRNRPPFGSRDARLIAEYVAIMPTRVVQRDDAVGSLDFAGGACVNEVNLQTQVFSNVWQVS